MRGPSPVPRANGATMNRPKREPGVSVVSASAVGEDSGASGEPAVGVVSEDVESIRCRIGLIDFRERALLLRHEDVNPEFEQVIGFAGGHLVETLELEVCHAVQCSPHFAYGVGVITVTSVVKVQS